MLRVFSLLPICAMLLSCTTSAQHATMMFADWNCTTAATIDNGDVRVVRWLGPSGALSSTVVLWIPKLPADARLRIMGRWEAHPTAMIDLKRGLVMFDQTVVSPGSRQRKPRYTIELRVQPDGPWDGHGQITGNFELHDGVRLSADWADVEAMSRGADNLFLIVKDRKGRTISTQALQPSLFMGFNATVARMLEETATMSQDFRTRC